jgi:hypothetical protein
VRELLGWVSYRIPTEDWACSGVPTRALSLLVFADVQDVAKRPTGPPSVLVNPLNLGKLLGVSGWGFTKRNEVGVHTAVRLDSCRAVVAVPSAAQLHDAITVIQAVNCRTACITSLLQSNPSRFSQPLDLALRLR